MVVFGLHGWIGLVEQWAPGGGQVRGIPTVRLGSVGHAPTHLLHRKGPAPILGSAPGDV